MKYSAKEYVSSREFIADFIDYLCTEIERYGSTDADFAYRFGESITTERDGKLNKMRLEIIESILHNLLKEEGYIRINLKNNVEVYTEGTFFKDWVKEHRYLYQMHRASKLI